MQAPRSWGFLFTEEVNLHNRYNGKILEIDGSYVAKILPLEEIFPYEYLYYPYY
tara:strand:+ start:1006 stop:1167 length:162 start_codon:yes stop_codon:yes gene_type:complete